MNQDTLVVMVIRVTEDLQDPPEAGQQVHQVPRDCVACPALGVKTVRMASQDHEDLLGCQVVPDSLETLAGKVPLAPRERRVLVDGQEIPGHRDLQDCPVSEENLASRDPKEIGASPSQENQVTQEHPVPLDGMVCAAHKDLQGP